MHFNIPETRWTKNITVTIDRTGAAVFFSEVAAGCGAFFSWLWNVDLGKPSACIFRSSNWQGP